MRLYVSCEYVELGLKMKLLIAGSDCANAEADALMSEVVGSSQGTTPESEST